MTPAEKEAPEMMGDGIGLRALSLYTRLLCVCTAVLIFAGALVTTTGSGLAVPDWPLSFGMIYPRMVGGVLYEHGHRMIAAGVGLMVLALLAWVHLVEAGRPLRRLAWVALAMVSLQGLLGGLTVLMNLPTQVSVAHGTLAQIFFCLTAALALSTSPSWRTASRGVTGPQARGLRRFAVLAAAAVLGQLVLGATMRHMGAGLYIPDFPTSYGALIPPFWDLKVAVNFAHRVWAYVVVTLLVYLALASRRAGVPELRRPAGWMLGLVSIQVLLGAVTVWSGRGLVPTSLHVLNGALVLMSVTVLGLQIFRCTSARSEGGDARQPQPAAASAEAVRGAARMADWIELTKPRLVLLAGLTTATGYYVGATRGFSWVELAQVFLGVLLMGAGGGTLNQVMEVEFDARMRRTASRPLPSGRLGVLPAALFGLALSVGGVVWLAALVNPLSAALAVAALVSYLLMYTPLKRRTSMCTVVGAIPGAIPPMIGWAAATGALDFGAWVLFCILFLWQLPHFWGIAWLYREDYERAGMVMLTSVDPEGRILANQIVLYSLALLPVSLLPTLGGMAGTAYFVSALVLGISFLAVGVRVARERTRVRARQLVLASVAYLPLLHLAMVLNRN